MSNDQTPIDKMCNILNAIWITERLKSDGKLGSETHDKLRLILGNELSELMKQFEAK
ncbi:MAG: hypothetical protein ACREBS_10230 [Nitrososphaerales archaeon]